MLAVRVFTLALVLGLHLELGNGMCPKVDSEALQEKRLDAFKSSFLAKLRLDHVPDNSVPRKRYNSLNEFDEDTKLAYEDAVNALAESYSGACSRCQHCRRPGDTQAYYAEVFTDVPGEVGPTQTTAEFAITHRTDHVMVKQARVKVPVEPVAKFHQLTRPSRAAGTQEVMMKLYTKEYNSQNETVSRRLVHKQKCDIGAHTATLDVTDLLTSLSTEGGGAGEGHRRVLEADLESDHDIAISGTGTRMTVVTTVGSNEGRSKRQNGIGKEYCSETPSETRCCLRNLMVNFREIGWHWVLWPLSLEIYYCSGTCPYLWPNSAERYPAVLNAYRQLNPTAAPEPCCSAQSIRGITAVIQMDPNKNPNVTNISDMIIESCICG